MEPITVRISEETLEEIETEIENKNISRAEYLREIIKNRHRHEQIQDEYEKKLSELEENLENLKIERDNLQKKLQEANNRVDSVNELVERVDKNQTILEKKAAAPLHKRIKWLVFGMDGSNQDE